MKTRTNPISGSEMIIPSSELASKIHSILCCVDQITDFENHCDAFRIQQEILELVETKGAQAAKERVEEIRDEIETVFFKGKTDQVLEELNAETE